MQPKKSPPRSPPPPEPKPGFSTALPPARMECRRSPARMLRCLSTCRSVSGISFPLRDNRKMRLCTNLLCDISGSCKTSCSLDEPCTGGTPLRHRDCSIHPFCFSPILFSAVAGQNPTATAATFTFLAKLPVNNDPNCTVWPRWPTIDSW